MEQLNRSAAAPPTKHETLTWHSGAHCASRRCCSMSETASAQQASLAHCSPRSLRARWAAYTGWLRTTVRPPSPRILFVLTSVSDARYAVFFSVLWALWQLQFTTQTPKVAQTVQHHVSLLCMNLSGYAGHVTIFISMVTIACCLVVGLGLGLGFGLDLVSGW